MYCLFYSQWPNKSPEPTAVGAGRSAVAVHVASQRWLSFHRYLPMGKSDTNFWTGPASGPYRVVGGCFSAFLLASAVLYLYVGTHEGGWRMLMWVPLFLLNAGGFFGLARTGRWWCWRRPPGR
jgi:hypothetical protein